MSSPPVSVVMSVFNGELFLSQAVESILLQTFRDFEFVVIDDGSTDSTPEILGEYAVRDSRVRVIRQANKGRAASLNIGIALAKGKYIARMDADDIALPLRLEKQIGFMELHPAIGLLGAVTEVINNVGQLLTVTRPPQEDSEIKSVMLRYNPMCHPSVLMRKEVVHAAGGYRKALLDADDYDLWLRMGERTQFANLDEPLLRYRVHSNQVSIRNMRHQALCVLAARAAATFRRQGGPDPLTGIEEVSQQLLYSLGVTADDIRETLIGVYWYWMEILKPCAPEAALQVVEGFLEGSTSEGLEANVVADAWLTAASLHYRQGRAERALYCLGRAFLRRPIVLGRPVKRAWHYLSRERTR